MRGHRAGGRNREPKVSRTAAPVLPGEALGRKRPKLLKEAKHRRPPQPETRSSARRGPSLRRRSGQVNRWVRRLIPDTISEYCLLSECWKTEIRFDPAEGRMNDTIPVISVL